MMSYQPSVGIPGQYIPQVGIAKPQINNVPLQARQAARVKIESPSVAAAAKSGTDGGPSNGDKAASNGSPTKSVLDKTGVSPSKSNP